MINNSEKRIGRFTSSQVYRLCKSLKSGAPTKAFETYIEEVGISRALNRSTKTEVKTRPMLWGKVMEVVLFNLLGMEYTLEHKSTVTHSEYGDFWSGTPDLVAKNKVGEIKCFEPMHFGRLSFALKSEDIETIKEIEPEAYWQTVSNAILCNKKRAEIIAYMPYRSELEEILTLIEESNFLERNELEPTDFYFMRMENIESLPYLPDDSGFSNINTFEFEVPEKDIEFLTNRIITAESHFKL